MNFLYLENSFVLPIIGIGKYRIRNEILNEKKNSSSQHRKIK